MLTMSLCHDCIQDKNHPEKYLGPSPDEVALVESAGHIGYKFVSSTNSGKIIEVAG